MRVFQDRLVNKKHIDNFQDYVERILTSNFGTNLNECQFELVEGESYAPTIYTDFLTTGMTPVYQEVTDRAKLKEIVN
jgi:hypothetical protein